MEPLDPAPPAADEPLPGPPIRLADDAIVADAVPLAVPVPLPALIPSEDERRRMLRPDDVPVVGWHLLVAVPGLWIAILVVGGIIGVLALLSSGQKQLSPAVMLLATLAEHALTLACMAILLAVGCGRGFLRSYHARWAAIRWLALGFAGGVALAIGYLVLAATVWPYDRMEDTFQLEQGNPANLLMFSVIAIAAAFAEEFYYRGLIFPVLRRWIGVAGAMAIVTVWFAALHLLGYYRAPLAMLTITTLGLAAVLLRHCSRSLLPSIAIHLAYNGTIVILAWIRAMLL